MQEKENSISLGDIFRVLWKNIILLGIITAVCLVIGAVYTFAVATPTYTSSASIIVSVKGNTSSTTEVNYSDSLRVVVTVSDAIKGNAILEPVAKEYESAGLTANKLAKKVNVTNSTNSMQITISVTDTNPKRSCELAQKIAQRCVDEAYETEDPVTHEITSQGVFFFAKNSICISSKAEEGTYASPNKTLYLLVSFVLGLVAGCVVIFIKEFMSNKYKTRQEIENSLSEKILGIFPDNKDKDIKNTDHKEVELIEPSIRAFEPYNKLLSNIKYSNLENPYKLIQFTSTLPNELKSTTAANLAYCMANNKNKVLIIDLDIRKSILHKTFNVSKENGIVEYAEGAITKEEAIKHSSFGVDIITSGKDVLNPVAVLETTRLQELLKEVREEYDYVILDTPPSLACSDPQIVSTYVDGVIFNVALNQSKKKDIQFCLDSLKNVDASIIGLSVTKAENNKRDSYYYYYANKE